MSQRTSVCSVSVDCFHPCGNVYLTALFQNFSAHLNKKKLKKQSKNPYSLHFLHFYPSARPFKQRSPSFSVSWFSWIFPHQYTAMFLFIYFSSSERGTLFQQTPLVAKRSLAVFCLYRQRRGGMNVPCSSVILHMCKCPSEMTRGISSRASILIMLLSPLFPLSSPAPRKVLLSSPFGLSLGFPSLGPLSLSQAATLWRRNEAASQGPAQARHWAKPRSVSAEI